MPSKTFRLATVLAGLSRALDLASSGLRRHHEMVALAAHRVGVRLAMDDDALELLCSAALVHDLGVSTRVEKLRIETPESFETGTPGRHADVGADRLATSSLLARYADVVRHHHERWDGRGPHGLARESIPLASRVIHVVDRLSVLLARTRLPLGRTRGAFDALRDAASTAFDPHVVECVRELLASESFVLDLTADFTSSLVRHLPAPPVPDVGVEELVGIAGVFAEVIDGKCDFTRRHSRLVARIARRLGERLGFEDADVRRLEVAGLLHDIGKLVIPEEILSSPRALTSDDYDAIRTHSYYTFHVLRAIDGFETIAEWAAFHHEKLDGTGYPFRLSAAELTLGARVISVADVTAALCEDRPYRAAMSEAAIVAELQRKVLVRALDGDVVREVIGCLPEFLSATRAA